MAKQITKQRINRIILAVLNSPNKSAQRAALWTRLHNMNNELCTY
jgi:hypothetical protein